MNFSKGLIIVASAFLLTAVQGVAQSKNDALEHELNQLYQKQMATEKMIQDQHAMKVEAAPAPAPQPVTVAPAAVAVEAPTTSATTAVTVNQVTVAPAQVRSESLSAPMAQQSTVFQSPVSQIEAAPLAPSRADQLRRARQDVEVQTEQAIVEQLEASRLEFEKKRQEALLKKISGADEIPAPAPAPVPVQQVVPVQVAPVVQAVPVSTETPAPVSKEISELKKDIESIKAEKEKPKDENYFSFGVGMPNYQNIINLKSDASFGLGFGFKSPNNVVFEGSLYYSLLRIERPTTSPFGGFPEIDNVDQYNGVAAIKYSFFSGKIRPLIGALASYTYREYSCGQFWTCNGRSRTHALDAGGLVGGEVQVSDTFSIGIEYQYLRNMTYRTEASIQPSMFFAMYPTGRIEDKDYSIFTVRGRVTF